jgi:ubiquinone/menaquinone biosynthesis C-methylase UbiE
MKDRDIEKILSDLESGYDLIADKFSGTRAFMWRDLGFVKDLVKPGDRVLDFGCGNGRLAGFLEGDYKEYVGVDISPKLINIAKQKYSNEKARFIKVHPVKSSLREVSAEGGQFNRVKLPLEDNYFDIIFSIAVFHHLPSREYRKQIAKELYRVLQPEGKLVVVVWNLWQRKFWKYHLKNLGGLGKLGKTGLNWRNIYIPFKDNEGNIFRRYHHAFTKRELGKLLEKSGFENLDCEKGFNIICIASKK